MTSLLKRSWNMLIAPPLDQIVENALEYLEQPADNGDDPRQENPPDDLAVHILAKEVEPPLSEMVQQLDYDQPKIALPRERQAYLDEPPSHDLEPMN
ncbi:hypothetical protein C0995_011467, partial [Termitomyces sp. Mi166